MALRDLLRRHDAGTFFQREEGLLEVGTGAAGDFDPEAAVARHLPPSAVRWATLALVLCAAASTGFGRFAADGRWPGSIAVVAVAAAALWAFRARPRGILRRGGPWSVLLVVIALHGWSLASAPEIVGAQTLPQIAAIAVEYAALAIFAAQWSAARMAARPRRFVRAEPQALVPLFDRSTHHPLESWID